MHHIIPKHAGGTNDPSNLISLTVEEHADAHRILYEQYGRIEDKVAWLSLTGAISKQETIAEVKRIGAKKGGESYKNKVKSLDGNELEKYKDRMKQQSKLGSEEFARLYKEHGGIWWTPSNKSHTEETLKKMRGPRPQSSGKNNSQYGKCWITNGIENKKVKITELENFIPLGWCKGRKF